MALFDLTSDLIAEKTDTNEKLSYIKEWRLPFDSTSCRETCAVCQRPNIRTELNNRLPKASQLISSWTYVPMGIKVHGLATKSKSLN